MYLKKIVCENMGPISHIDIEPGFTAKGNPKPIILVGKNGMGKSILISNIVDSFFEFTHDAFDDATVNYGVGGHKFYKVSSDVQIRKNQKYFICYLQYIGSNSKIYEYIAKRGDVNLQSLPFLSSSQVKSKINDKITCKVTTKDRDFFKEEFIQYSMMHFPAERYSLPNWLNKDYLSSDNGIHISPEDHFGNLLNKPFLILNSTEENLKWIVDVIVDSRLDVSLLRRVNHSEKFQEEYALKQFLNKARETLEKILSEIVEQPAEFRFNLRASGRSRLSICDTSVQNLSIAPTLDSLSTGQILLLDMFSSIMRYSDKGNCFSSTNLNEIKGVVIIDEIELHLHSDLQRKVLPSLIKLFPQIQFIITTHSPLFLLGMRSVFTDEGFDIYEMPDGEKINAEDFSEFEKAYNTVSETQKFREERERVIAEQAIANEKALIITEGETDWKHMKRAWTKLKACPEYIGMDGKFEFLEYESPNSNGTAPLKLQMSDNELVTLCENTAKIPQHRKMIFISDADHPEKTKRLSEEGKLFRHWHNNIYSFQIPIPQHRIATPKICIEHYYTDNEIRTPKIIEKIERRLFMGNEFDKRGISLDGKYVCIARNECGEGNIAIIEGDSKTRISLISDESTTVALSKTKFAEAILGEEDDFSKISSDNFRLIFDIIKAIIGSVSLAPHTEPSKDIHQKSETVSTSVPPRK